MRCLVTGASGFLGSALIPKLLDNGHTVIVLARPNSNLSCLLPYLDRVQVLQGKVGQAGMGSAESGNRAQEPCFPPIDAVVHLAWAGVTAESRNDPSQISYNLNATLHLWELSRLAGCTVWVGVGSQAEYGPVNCVLREDTPTFPVTAYGVAKLAAGLATAKMSELCGMRHVWLRLLSAYGPRDDERHMIPSLIQALLAGRRPELTAGEQVWDYLYVEDVASAVCAALASQAHGVFNLASGLATTLRSVVEQVRDLIDPKLPLGFGVVPYRSDKVMRLEADVSRWKAATGWKPETSLADGLHNTVSWFRERTKTEAGYVSNPAIVRNIMADIHGAREIQ